MCPVNFNFDEANQICDYPVNFPCSTSGGGGGSAQCPSTPPNCASYRNGYFVNNPSNCRAYWYCANTSTQPVAGMCPVNFNFHEANQLCDHPANFPCTDSGAPPGTTAQPPITTPPPITGQPPITTTPTTTSTTTTTSPGGGTFVDVAVQEHNRYRALHGSPNVASFSNDINQFAQQWAEHLASTDQFYHSSGSGFGENLYMAWGGSSDPKVLVADAIKYFYDEIRFYDWNNPVFSLEAGHFTQVVWKASTEIGVGVSVHPNPGSGHRSVVAINYRPPGNYAGQFGQNVPRLLGSRFTNSNSTESYSGEKPIKIMVL